MTFHTLHRTPYNHLRLKFTYTVALQTYVLIVQSQHDIATACIHSSNEDQHRVIITIVVYLEHKQNSKRVWVYLRPHTLYQTPMITLSNFITQQHKRTSCLFRANMTRVQWASLYACNMWVFGRHIGWWGFEAWAHETPTKPHTIPSNSSMQPNQRTYVLLVHGRHDTRSIRWTQIESPSSSLHVWTAHKGEIMTSYILYLIKHFKSERAAVQAN